MLATPGVSTPTDSRSQGDRGLSSWMVRGAPDSIADPCEDGGARRVDDAVVTDPGVHAAGHHGAEPAVTRFELGGDNRGDLLVLGALRQEDRDLRGGGRRPRLRQSPSSARRRTTNSSSAARTPSSIGGGS
jgi:hypothetical protein